MNFPGFTAETSLGPSLGLYVGSAVHAGDARGAIAPMADLAALQAELQEVLSLPPSPLRDALLRQIGLAIAAAGGTGVTLPGAPVGPLPPPPPVLAPVAVTAAVSGAVGGLYGNYVSGEVKAAGGSADTAKATGTVGGVCAGFLTGAAIGSVVPVLGTAVGGAIGAVAGGIAGFIFS
jgi:hypothetical protein